MTIINRFERSCGTFKGGGGKTHHHQHTGSVCPPKKKKNLYLKFKNNNDHGVDVSIIMAI
jgi:hypothetical protein